MLQLFAHPFSSYCQKVLIALYENDTPFEWRRVDEPDAMDELAARWPFKQFPILVDEDETIVEATIIIEHLAIHHPGPVAMLPADPGAALDVRALDRFFDNYVMTPQQKIVFDHLREPGDRDAVGAAQARAMLETAYTWLDLHMADREWASGDFSLADCAAAPALFYADWTHPIPARFANVHAYRRRLLARPSFARAVDEARPFRAYFPLGAPDRD
ncbi:glutathione S-transferase family protein [Glacieibacterium frigidum]|uniref:Glutathione S-transferase family protein n=1 Tax=Glacieibacterium frigidum TaxID=2593303 RepID=A0A552UFH2_9SPHN|nr:glutathione S-transferase family protein [Glacieibacterium frigidum]TRW16941.1 glutathione S-transferase family protein [Glacieibacterium frigidum]